MKVLITTDLFFVETNGVVTSIKNLVDALEKRGHEVRSLTISDKMKSYKQGNVSFIRSLPIKVYAGTRMPTSYRHKLIKELVEWCPDVIHSQCEFFSLRFARYISKKTDAPIVHTYHTMYEDYVGYVFLSKRMGIKFARWLTKRIFESVDSIILPTDKVRERHVENGITCEFNVVPSGIDLARHREPFTAQQRSELRAKYGISDGDTLLISLGRVAPEKNINELIDYYKKVSEKNPSLKFMIVGAGPAMHALEEQVKTLGLEGRVVFTGMVKPDEVHKYYRIGDLFLSASTSETQGLTYIEAAANGLPLLCRRDPCLDGVIVAGENGYEYENEQEFITLLDCILSDKDKMKKMGECSLEIVKPYDKSVFGESVERVYEAAVQKKREQKKAKEDKKEGKNG